MSVVNLEVEKDALGGMMLASLQGAPIAIEIAGILGEDAFTQPDHRAIYATLIDLARAEKPHDGISVAAAMKGNRDGIEFADIVSLMHNTASTVNLEHRARQLRDLASRRAVIGVCHEAMSSAEHLGASEVIAMLTRKLDDIAGSGSADAMSFSEVVDRTEIQLDELARRRHAGKSLGVPFGIPAVDMATSGMQRGELIGIAARTSIGKTALANQVAVHAASKGHRGLILSLEESPEGIGLRAIANRGGVNLTLMRAGAVSLDTTGDIVHKHGLREYPLWVDTNTFDLSQIAARITQYARKHKIEFAIVDHIGLVRVPSSGGKKRYETIGEVTRTLKLLAAQLGIAVVGLIQVGRDSEKESRRPMLSDLRESGNIEQDLNVCIAMHPKGQPDERGKVDLEIGILKNRYGLRGWLRESFEFHGSVQQLRQMFHAEREDNHAA